MNLTPAEYAAIRASGHAPAAPPVARRPRTPKFARPVAVEVLGKFVAVLPIVTDSIANRRGHWAKHEPRRQGQQLVTAAAMRGCRLVPPVRIGLVRVAPRALDDDNCVTSLKYVRDSIAAHFGVDDRHDDLLDFKYAQAAGDPCVLIVIEQCPQQA